jgi:hypothetical protein
MQLKEFITNFSEEYYVANLDDINGGSIVAHIVGDIYLIRKGDIHDIQEGILNG